MADLNKVGGQIAALRKAKGLTQVELGERLGVTFQAVSKWERSEALPDVGILVDLAAVLETSVDNILTGGEKAMGFKGKKRVADVREGLECLDKFGKLIGRDNLVYRNAIDGINNGMNTDIEECFRNDYIFECFMAEIMIQSMKSGYYFDTTEIKNSFKHEKFRDIVLNYAERYGIK